MITTDMKHGDADLVIFSDYSLEFALDMDQDNEDPTRSLYIKSGGLRIRQFAKLEQLIALRDMLVAALPTDKTTEVIAI